MTDSIPGPAAWPLVGNAFDVQGEVPVQRVEALMDKHGPIIQLVLRGQTLYFVGGFDLFDELCDETRFYKIPPLILTQGNGDRTEGLLTSASEKEADWAQAHRILVPAFGPLAIQAMFGEMHDIATQLVMKWARTSGGGRVLLTEEFTRLTLDSIALCAMDYRFNSFYTETVHPYVQALTARLRARSEASQVGQLLRRLVRPWACAAEEQRDEAYMQQVGRSLVQHRRDHPTDKADLLNAMIHGSDPETGETMRDELIAANMGTFLVAGHETTSGLLSFAFMYMLLNPSTFAAAQQEVDRVVGRGRLEAQHLGALPYLSAVLRETLRLAPTAPGFARGVRPENTEKRVTLAGGRYEIPRDVQVLCLLGRIQRDPKVFGADADVFRPERMLDDRFGQLPKNAWKPFGTGLRGCIGRAFAWQEALLAMALVLQNFTMALDDPSYQMQLQQTISLKPKNAYVRVRLRHGLSATDLLGRLSGSGAAAVDSIARAPRPANWGGRGPARPLHILYGSNTGTCQSLAQSLAAAAAYEHGYTATVAELDSAIERMPTDGPVVIVTASHEGEAPDNAARFVAWLQQEAQQAQQAQQTQPAWSGVRYAVFGCGHKDWVSTYQRVPALVDELLAERGAVRLAVRGSSDVSKQDAFGDFAAWMEQTLWPAMSAADAAQTAQMTTTTLALAVPTMDAVVAAAHQAMQRQRQAFVWATVTEARVLTTSGEPEKRHIGFQLPPDVTYSTGDHLAVLPRNPEAVVRRAMQRFGLPWDAAATDAISVVELLRGYVELSMPATVRDIRVLAKLAGDEDRASLERLATPAVFKEVVVQRRTSLLDLLEQHAAVRLPLARFLSMLPPLHSRRYSIASSPLAGASKCSLCYSVLHAPAWSGSTTSTTPRRFHGVASTYLQSLRPGDRALVAVRATSSTTHFRLPAEAARTPLVLFCAGAGLAPFMGFLQERARQRQQGQRLAPALLFIGCRDAEADRLYGATLDGWSSSSSAVVDVRYAFSRQPDHPRAAGCARITDRLWRDQDDVVRLWAAGALMYVCGSARLTTDLRAVAQAVLVRRARVASLAEAAAWLSGQRNRRIVTDVFT